MLTTTAANNKLIKYRTEIYREYVRENLFSPYMGTAMNSIIRVITDLDKGGKNGGEQINIPLRARLNGQGVGSGQLRGNEEQLDNQGTRFFIDWSRHSVAVNNAEKTSPRSTSTARSSRRWSIGARRSSATSWSTASTRSPRRPRLRVSALRLASASTASCSMPQPQPNATPGSPTMPIAS
jgi:hypothetical protein